MIHKVSIIFLLLAFYSNIAKAQCCASSGNPIGGTVNIGILDKNVLRIASFYRTSYSDKYLKGDELYTGEIATLKKAGYNFIGLLAGYGITDKISIEIETGYYINKTQVFKDSLVTSIDEKLTGYGLSDVVISIKPMIYNNPDKKFEISCGIGANIPFSRELQHAGSVILPVDLQPSTGSFGLVFQTNIIKENSFRSMSFLLVSRIQKYFENKQNYTYGNSYSNSVYFSKYFSLENKHINGWTLILQLKNQITEKSLLEGHTIDGSGNCSFFLVPQINLSVFNDWNISILFDIPFYQYYNDIQLANKTSFALSVTKDIFFRKQTL
jgi:hypothetical protein